MRRRVREIALSTVPWRTRTPTPHGAGEGSRTGRRRGLFASSTRRRARQDPCRWRGTATSRGEPPGSRDPPVGSAGRPLNLSGGARTIGAKAGLAATISNAPSTEPPGLEGPGGRHPMLPRKPEDFPWDPHALRHGPEGPAVEPENPAEPGGPPPWPRRTWWDPEGPGSTRPPRDPERASRPTGPPLPRRAEGGVHRKAKGGDARQSPSGPTVWAWPGGDPPGRPRVHRNGPAGLAEPQSSLRRSAIPGTRLRVLRRCSDRTPLRAEARHGTRLRGAAHASPASRRFRVPEQGCRAAVSGQDEMSAQSNFLVHNLGHISQSCASFSTALSTMPHRTIFVSNWTPKYWGLYMATRYVVGFVLQCSKRQAYGWGGVVDSSGRGV